MRLFGQEHKMEITEAGAHEFMFDLNRNGNHLRALCIKKGPPPVLAIWKTLPTQSSSTAFDPRELSRKRILVLDENLINIVKALFLSFDPPINPEIVREGGHEAQASRLTDIDSILSTQYKVSIADFSKISLPIFRIMFPQFIFQDIVFGPNKFTGTSIKTLGIETILYGDKSIKDEIYLGNLLLGKGDLSRLRELEYRFSCKLYPVSEIEADKKDVFYKDKEKRLLQSGNATLVDYRPSINTRFLEFPKDPTKQTLVIDYEEIKNPRLGMALMMQIGSYPKQPWYVHEIQPEKIRLRTWLPVEFGRKLDFIGQTDEGRDIFAVRGEVTPIYDGSPKLFPGMMVGNDNTVGELYLTAAGSYSVLGKRPLGEPSTDPLIRDSNRKTGGRLPPICHSRPTAITEELCEKAGGVWDQPCTRDHECPFFSGDMRGGCIDGFCEMPLGVSNSAFKKYEGEPICIGCDPNSMDPIRCCAQFQEPNFAWMNQSR